MFNYNRHSTSYDTERTPLPRKVVALNDKSWAFHGGDCVDCESVILQPLGRAPTFRSNMLPLSSELKHTSTFNNEAAYSYFSPENGGCVILRNVSIRLEGHTSHSIKQKCTQLFTFKLKLIQCCFILPCEHAYCEFTFMWFLVHSNV